VFWGISNHNLSTAAVSAPQLHYAYCIMQKASSICARCPNLSDTVRMAIVMCIATVAKECVKDSRQSNL
jgi:hypothetical protein